MHDDFKRQRIGTKVMFGFFKNKFEVTPYDKESETPVIKSSVCTGEKVAGFMDIRTGKIREVMLIANDQDLKFYCKKYNVSENEIKYVYP